MTVLECFLYVEVTRYLASTMEHGRDILIDCIYN